MCIAAFNCCRTMNPAEVDLDEYMDWFGVTMIDYPYAPNPYQLNFEHLHLPDQDYIIRMGLNFERDFIFVLVHFIVGYRVLRAHAPRFEYFELVRGFISERRDENEPWLLYLHRCICFPVETPVVALTSAELSTLWFRRRFVHHFERLQVRNAALRWGQQPYAPRWYRELNFGNSSSSDDSSDANSVHEAIDNMAI